VSAGRRDRARPPRRDAARSASARAASARAASALAADAARFGLRADTVATALGPVVVRRSAERGSDEALLLLHGAAGSWSTWTPLLAAAARTDRPLADVVAPDLPGFGDSPGPPDADALTGPAVADALVTVLRHLGYRRWRVVGHSLGAAIALDLAAAEPDAAVGLVLASPPVHAAGEVARHPVLRASALPWYAGMLAVMRIGRAAPRFATGALRILRRTGLLRVIASPLFADARAVDRTVPDALAAEVRPAAFLAAAREAARTDDRGWTRIRCPVVAVSGDRDVFVAPVDRDALIGRVPHATWRVLERCGHFPHVERADAVLDAILGT